MDVASNCLGLSLKNLLVASASPLTIDPDNIGHIEDGGSVVVMLPSLFEEQSEQQENAVEQYSNTGPIGSAAMLSYLPSAAAYRTQLYEYLQTIHKACRAVAIPLIAGLNGVTGAGRTRHARLVQEAGADAIERKVSFIPAAPSLSADQVEHRSADVVRAIESAVGPPCFDAARSLFHCPARAKRIFSRATTILGHGCSAWS